MREEGYYWVNYYEYESDDSPNWIIMYWYPEWDEFVLNGEIPIKESETVEIDEQRIFRLENKGPTNPTNELNKAILNLYK